MIVHLSNIPNGILIQVAAYGGGPIGDASAVVRPGESALGRPYAWWAGLGEGEHEIGGDA